jgi:hypothetical protein
MIDDFYLIKTEFGICRVAESLRHFHVLWEEYLKKRKEEADPLNDIRNVSGISVRGWLCKWQRGKIRMSLGQRAKHDSSPNMNEALGWGGFLGGKLISGKRYWKIWFANSPRRPA